MNAYNKEITSSDSERVRVTTNNVLSISNLQESDSGSYTCLASNMAANHNKSVQLVVSGSNNNIQNNDTLIISKTIIT